MMKNGDEPAAGCTHVGRIGGGTFPYGYESVLQKIFGNLVIGYHAVGQRIEYAAIALVERFQCPRSSPRNRVKQRFITQLISAVSIPESLHGPHLLRSLHMQIRFKAVNRSIRGKYTLLL